MKKKVIAFFLSVVLASGSIVPALATETTAEIAEEAVIEEETAEETTEESEEITEETADAETEEVAEGASEEESAEEIEEEPAQELTEEAEDSETETIEETEIAEDLKEADSADIADTSAEMAEAVEPEAVTEEAVAEAEGKEAKLAGTEDVVDSGTCGDNATWTLTGTGDDLTLTISGSGDMEDFLVSGIPWAYQKAYIKTVVVEEGVTSIGRSAFEYCDALENVIIANSVTSIGFSAFSECESLTHITIPNNVTNIGEYAFSNCWSLESISIPDRVTNIPKLAFFGCSSLKSLIIPDSVEVIGDWAFADCDSLVDVTIGDSVTTIGERVFWECISLESITIPDNVESIGELLFWDCSNLKSVVIGDGVTAISDETFKGCSSLTSVTIGRNVTSIGFRAFSDCSSLKSITIPDNVTSIAGYIFIGCSSLTSITLPGNVTSIAAGMFKNCSSLKSFTIPDSVTNIGGEAFYGCNSLESITIPYGVTTIEGSAFADCYNLKSITIPDSVNEIQQCAFFDCWSLESITIPEGVTNIDVEAFFGCNSLKSITIPEGVTSIEYRAFLGCDSLENITIPDSVTYIGESAFAACDGLKSITISKGITSIEKSTFDACSSLKSITIPDGVMSIGESAFEDCDSLKSVTIPVSVTSIDEDAFLWCYSLTDFYYSGTKTEWDAIEGSEFINDMNCLIHTKDGVYGSIHAEEVTLNKTSAILVNGKTLQLKATVTPADATDGKVTWKSGNTNVATVTSTGSIKAVSAGSTTITAVTEGGLKASCTIKVVNPYTIKFDKNVEKKVAAKVTLTTKPKKVNPGDTLGTLPTPGYSGYYFLGWYTARSGGTKVTPSTKPTKNMTLYAHWVVRKSIKKATVKVGSCMYTGNWCRPSVTVMLGTKTLKKHEDYSISYSNCLDAGSKGVIKITGKGRYKDSISRTFTVSKCSMGEKYISAELSKTTYNYTGKAIKPGITVYLNVRHSGRKLIKGIDYSVSYKNNIEPGKATVQITGKGNFESKSRYFTFTIAKLNQPIKLSRTSLSLRYKNIGTTYDVTATGVKESAGMTVSSSNTSVATVSGSGGKYKIKIKGCGKTNIIFKTNKATKHYKITSIKLPITVADRKMPTISLPQQTYDLRAGDAPFNLGATCDSDGVITYTSSDTEILTVDKTGTVTLTGNKGGSVNITVTSKATQNYKEGTAVVNVTVTIKPIWEIRMEEFQKDSRWSVNDAAWGDGKKPELSNASDSESCVAYANDFVAYVYGQRNQKSDPRKANRPDRTSDESSAGTDPGIIKAGDIIQFFKGYNAKGERLIHLIVVISVDHSTGMMYTMEGNAGHKIRIGSNYYRINNGKVEESFISGWTVQTIDWIKQFDSWKD